ncbi:hypothetical protein DR864_23860 [Runella rosea]|uniref:MORN repeat variant n=1 Tax=Runella rosea TaxID=2259595 RepID=A0A344TPI2_9BACT|nr:hypothetical protein [Runella rosea]AXE20553.1 hypothetical protein DR864_23860 [Runella rosea]
MKIFIICLGFCWLLAGEANAFLADTVATTVQRKSFSTHDEEVTFYDKKKRFATLRIYDKSGLLLTETNFKDYKEGIRQGFSKGFYPNGDLYWIADYKNNEKFGEFKVYYPDGSIKRREWYRNGMRKDKHCYDLDGNEVEFYEFSGEPMFRGGEYALQGYLRKKLKDISPTATEFYSFVLLVQADSVATLHTFKNSSFVTLQQLADIIKDMPRWIPAHFDGVPSDRLYAVNLMFRSGNVYLTNLATNMGNMAQTKKQIPTPPTTPPPFPTTRRRQ